MLHGAILRSPYAHAKIVSIDTTRGGGAARRCKAVITGAVLETLGLAWMPTLSVRHAGRAGHRQGALPGPGGRVRRRRGPVLARDALELIEVEYEPLPAVVDAKQALDPDAPVIRDDKEGKTDNHIFDWEAGDEAKTDAVVRRRRRGRRRGHALSARAPGADGDLRRGRRHGQGHRQADGLRRPPRRRTRTARSTRWSPGLPEHKIRVISPDIGGGFGNKVGIYPGYVLAVVGSIVTGKPVKWMEDRSENLMSHRVRPRLPHARRDRGDQGRQDPRRCGSTCWPTTARSTARPSRRSSRPASSTSSPGPTTCEAAHCNGQGRLHQQGTRRRRVRLLVPDHRGRVPGRAAWSTCWPSS